MGYTEDALHAMGLMSCISALEGGYGERSEGGRYSSLRWRRGIVMMMICLCAAGIMDLAGISR